MATYPLQIWTVLQQLENGYTVTKWCPTCKTWAGELDLAGLVAAGYGDRPPMQLGLKCRTCRTPVFMTIYPPMDQAAGWASLPAARSLQSALDPRQQG